MWSIARSGLAGCTTAGREACTDSLRPAAPFGVHWRASPRPRRRWRLAGGRTRQSLLRAQQRRSWHDEGTVRAGAVQQLDPVANAVRSHGQQQIPRMIGKDVVPQHHPLAVAQHLRQARAQQRPRVLLPQSAMRTWRRCTNSRCDAKRLKVEEERAVVVAERRLDHVEHLHQ